MPRGFFCALGLADGGKIVYTDTVKNKPKENTMVKDVQFYRNLALLSLPIAAQNILTFLVGLADNVMAARLGEAAVSGIFVANQITTLLQMFVTGLAAGMTVLAAQYWGKRDLAAVRSIVGIAFRFALAVGALLFAVVSLFPHRVIGLFTDDPAALEAGVEYIRILAWTYIPFCLTSVLIAALRCVETVRIGAFVAAMALVLNVLFNWLLIFGKLGFPRLGLRGAAWATLISRLCELAVAVVFTWRIDRKLRLTLRDLCALRSPFTRDFLHYGLPVIAGDLLWGLNMATQGGIVGRLGVVSVSAVSIANTVLNIIAVGLYGTRDASAVVIGKTVGSGDIPRVKQYAKTLQVVYLLLGVCTGALVFASRYAIPFVYSGMEPQTIALSQQLLLVLSVTIVGTAYQMSVLTGIVRAGGATRFVLYNDLIFVWGVVIPSAMIAAFVFHAPTPVVFACLKCDQILKCAVAVVKVNRFRWIRNLTEKTENRNLSS